MNCQSCGMPMDKPEDHGGGNVSNLYCKFCVDESGNLLPRDQVRAKMAQFYVQKQNKTQEEAEKLTDQLMGTMPAWKGGDTGGGAPSEPPTPPAAPGGPAEPPKTEEPEPTPPPETTPEESPAPSPAPEPTPAPEPAGETPGEVPPPAEEKTEPPTG